MTAGLDGLADLAQDGLADLVQDFQTTGGPPPHPERCPSPETILDAVRGKLAHEALRDVLDHTITCAPCAEDWRLAVAFEREAKIIRFRSWRAYAAAAAAVLALAILPSITNRQDAPHPPGKVSRGVSELRLHHPEQPLSPTAFRLRWIFPEDEAATYDLEVRGPKGQILFQKSGITALDCTVPPGKLAGVEHGSRLTWKVTAHLQDGRLVVQEDDAVLE